MDDTRTATAGRWLALLTVAVGVSALFIAGASRITELPGELARWRIGEAELLLANGQWHPVSLPRRTGTGEAASGSYRIRLPPRGASEGPRALLMAQAFGHVDLFLGDVPIGSGGPLAESPRHRAPFYVLLPAAATAADSNTLTLRIGGGHALDAPLVGPASVLRPAFESALFIQVRLKQIILGVLLGVALMTALLFSLRPGERHYGWFSLAAAASAVHFALSLHQGQSSDPQSWEAPSACAALWATLFAAFFLDRLFERKPHAGEHLLLTGSLVASAASFTAIGPAACDWLAAAAALYLCVRLAYTLHRQWRISTCLLLVVALLMIAVHAHDRLAPMSPPLLIYTAIPALVIAGGLILGRFISALRESEALTRQFDARVAASNLELERGFAQIEAVQREQVLSAERQRIMRDMHDGVGGQLVQALASAEADLTLQPLTPMLRASLDDLRLVVDSFGDGSGNLASALAMLRWRTRRRCQQAWAQCEWIVAGIDASAVFRLEAVLQTLRAVQRGVDLALTRPGASLCVRVTCEAAASPDVLHVEVRGDDGTISRASIPLNTPPATEHTS